MHPCLAIPVFAFVSTVARLDAYSFDTELRPILEEGGIVLQNGQPSSIESLPNDHYLFDTSSKEEIDDDLGNLSHSENYAPMWSTRRGRDIGGDSKLSESSDVIQDLQGIQDNRGFPSFDGSDYLNAERFRTSKRSPVEQKEEYLMNAEGNVKSKRSGGHSLSIVNPLDVLRQRMMLDMARQRMAKNQAQIQINDSILQKLGKRSYSLNSFARGGQLLSGDRSAQRKRRQRKDYIGGKQVPVFEQL